RVRDSLKSLPAASHRELETCIWEGAGGGSSRPSTRPWARARSRAAPTWPAQEWTPTSAKTGTSPPHYKLPAQAPSAWFYVVDIGRPKAVALLFPRHLDLDGPVGAVASFHPQLRSALQQCVQVAVVFFHSRSSLPAAPPTPPVASHPRCAL